MRAIKVLFALFHFCTFYSVAYGGGWEYVDAGLYLGRNESGEIVLIDFCAANAWKLYQQKPGYKRHDYENVDYIRLLNHNVNAAELKHMLAFPALKYLILGEVSEGIGVEDHALDGLNAPKLEGLQLCKSELKDADLSFLPRLTNLKYLTIIIGTDHDRPPKPNGLTDRAASWIAQLSELTELNIFPKGRLTDH